MGWLILTADGVFRLLSDEELARGIQQGRTGDLIGLVERHYDPLVGYFYRMTGGDRMLSEDMVQETFLRVLRGIHRYDYPRPFKPWLYAIATNLGRNYYKRADTRRTVLAEDDPAQRDDQADPPENTLIANDETQSLIAALDRLPEHQRQAIILRYCQELSLDEMADILNIPVGTVKSRLSIGLRRLRQVMEQQTYE